MNAHKLSRRKAMARTSLLAGVAELSPKFKDIAASEKPQVVETGRPFLYCLNTATIRGQKLGIVKEIEVAAQAGYEAIEPWVDSIAEYVKNGGKLSELKQRISNSGLRVESAIGFPDWIVDD